MVTRHLVKDFMRHDILVTAHPKTSINEAARKMAQFNVGSIVIVDENNKILGIFTERDLVKAVANSINLNTELEKVMTKNPVRISYDEYIEKALLVMRENNVRHLPVVNKEDKFVGMISLRDLTKLISVEDFE
ncbi:MAG TPA: CBS domain-containing protein [Geobacterales bacterium]|nr:CBS domain-containing protein [Geobacterales bacterium]